MRHFLRFHLLYFKELAVSSQADLAISENIPLQKKTELIFWNIWNRFSNIIFLFLQKVWIVSIYSRISFCEVSFYDDSLLRPLSSRTEHSRLVVHHCRNSSVLSVLSALLALFRCACASSYSILVQFFQVYCDFSTHWRPSKRQKRRINQNIWRCIHSWCLLNHSLGLLRQNKKWFVW